MTDYEKAVEIWQQRRISNDAELAEALNSFSVKFAYHSCKIENDRVTYHDTREIFEHDSVSSYTGNLRTLIEIWNAKQAHELFLVLFSEKRPIDEGLIKEFHYKLTQGTYDDRRIQIGESPGEYKRHDYRIGKAKIGSAPTDVSAGVCELLDDLKDISDDKILDAAAYFHAKFESIHPFADGNGRVGRMLMNYFLVLHEHLPIIIYEEDRNIYYNVLEEWDDKRDLQPLCEFLKEQTVKTWKQQIERKGIR